MESSAYAGRRCDSGTSAATDCRITEKTGSVSSPPTSAATSRAGYGRTGATPQNTASATVVTASMSRRPRRSTSRPSSGAPSAVPTVDAAPTSPAAPYPRCRSSTTCRVSVTPTAVTGTRASRASRISGRTPGSASTRR